MHLSKQQINWTQILGIVSLIVGPFRLFAQTYGELDTGFEISLSRRTEIPPGIQATILTTNTYPCEGYSIRSQVTWQKDTINIRILGFVRPTPCFSTSSEATGTAYLSNPGNGSYIVRLLYRGEEDMHLLFIRENKITIIPMRDEFSKLEWK